jgi:hypothetical protein
MKPKSPRRFCGVRCRVAAHRARHADLKNNQYFSNPPIPERTGEDFPRNTRADRVREMGFAS